MSYSGANRDRLRAISIIDNRAAVMSANPGGRHNRADVMSALALCSVEERHKGAFPRRNLLLAACAAGVRRRRVPGSQHRVPSHRGVR